MFYYLDPSTPPPPPVARTIFFLMAPTTREGLHHSHWPLFTTQVDKEEKGAPVSSWERCEVPMQAAAVRLPSWWIQVGSIVPPCAQHLGSLSFASPDTQAVCTHGIPSLGTWDP